MADKQQRAAKEFADYWDGRGYEDTEKDTIVFPFRSTGPCRVSLALQGKL